MLGYKRTTLQSHSAVCFDDFVVSLVTCQQPHFQRQKLHTLSGVFTDVFSENKMLKSHHRPYFRHLTKIPVKKTHRERDKGTGSTTMLTHFLVLGLHFLHGSVSGSTFPIHFLH